MKKRYNNPKCRTCMFRAAKTALYGCDYLLITEHSRGCSVKDCNKYKKGPRVKIEKFGTTIVM